MSKPAILLVRVLSIANFSTSLLKYLLNISASSSLLLIVLLSEKRGATDFQNFLLSETVLWSTFPRKMSCGVT